MSSEKTEKPTPKKRRDAKNKGQVAKSKEIVSLSLLLSIAGIFWFFGDYIMHQIFTLFELPQIDYDSELDEVIVSIFLNYISVAFNILSPFLVTVFIVGIFSNVVQTGWVFSGEPVKPELKKIDPIQGAKKIFSLKNLMEFVKSVIKIGMLGYTAYAIFYSDLNSLFGIPYCGPLCAISMTSSIVMKVILYCLAVFVFLAIADFALETYMHTKQLKMSIEEVRREYKETEGSPEIKGRRKQLHQELVDEAIQKQVSKSDFIVTNPTRLAVGIRYDKDEGPLPWVTLKGELFLAKKIREEAEKQGVPIIQKKYLARGLYANLDMGEFISSEFIEPIAEIIKWIRDVNKDNMSHYEN